MNCVLSVDNSSEWTWALWGFSFASGLLRDSLSEAQNWTQKRDKTSEAVLDAQASFVTSEARGQEASSEYESFDDDDVERNADVYIFNHEVAQC